MSKAPPVMTTPSQMETVSAGASSSSL